ncbi:transcription factor bHLH48-like [Punica granatum]|uniref:Transcription factor bHLH48-like n=2 Tax=Punica granatum TaxID=22663 RepID=A0A6P8CDT2_PUNGR|nr:transcription factor bHLH48-like [Punica granatum]PKI42861.1 hypothetical protein CRG98_036659 [Punica granatum]
MEPLALTADRSDVPAFDTLQFNEEIQRLIAPPLPPGNAASFTALLELAPTQAVELLRPHEPPGSKPYFDSAADGAALFPLPSSAPVDCSAKYAAFAGGSSSSPDASVVSLQEVKSEAGTDSTSRLSSQPQPQPVVSDPAVESKGRSSGKRKEREQKGKGSAKKKKKKNESSDDGQILPYVHVRARRGQATDSHSLAERARREKINARMKLLQELVPGCDKISGTALVLDEIINHVQSLQCQVELLSMKLAAVNPQIDFNLDSIFAAEHVSLLDSDFPVPLMWPDFLPQQWHFLSLQQSVFGKEEDTNFVAPEISHLTCDYSADAAPLSSHQMKMEM